jgi:cyanosortase A-associated protein
LRVDVRPQYGDSNVGRLLAVASEVKSDNAKLQPQYQPGLGNYGVLVHNNRLYLTACINARGESTLTNQQFQQNRYSHDLQLGRILPWVLGQKSSLFDERCLWTLMSTPLPANAEVDLPQVKAAYQSLESAWKPMQQWWQANFPAEL